MPRVVTANVLRTGAVVYLREDGTWVPNLSEATAAETSDAFSRLETLALTAVQSSDVTAVYAFDVAIVDGRPEPIAVREKIRAAGAPTV
jgi:hypothetical protein